MNRKTGGPPRFAKRIFRWYCGRAAVDDLEGDMDEIFHSNLRRMSSLRARWKYWLQVVSFIGSYAIKKRRINAALHPHSNQSINLNMIRNYILMAWRIMSRNRVYTLINVLGLTLGITASIIVYIIIYNEMNFDRFHPDKERIYRLNTVHEGDNQWTCGCIHLPVFPILRDEYAGVEAITAYYDFDAKSSITENGQVKRFDRNSGRIIVTNAQYFDIFQYEWLAGSPATFSKPMQVVITANRAKTYFGDIEPDLLLGKVITYNDSLQLTVAGVVKDWTQNSDFVRTDFISLSTVEHTFLKKVIPLDNWGMLMHSSQGFVKIKVGSDADEIAKQIRSVVRKRTPEPYGYKLEPLTNIHFLQNDEGTATIKPALYSIAALAAFILGIASINFINLATAQSINRSREIGIRKVMGSVRRQIVVQFLSETFVLSSIALLLSLALVRSLLLTFGDFLRGNTFDLFAMDHYIFLGCLLVGISLLAGVYPALVTSSHAPASNLSTRYVTIGRSTFSLRRALVVFQFTMSLFFITVTLIVSDQMNYIKTKDRGFSTQNVLTFRTNFAAPVDKVQILVDQIRSFTGEESVTMQGLPPMGFAMSTNSFAFLSGDGKIEGQASVKAGDEQYIPLYRFRLIAGRNYLPADSAKEAVVNEAFVKSVGLSDPQKIVGEEVMMNGYRLSICGVVKDFHQQSFRNAIGPCLIANFKGEEHSVAVRFDTDDIAVKAKLSAKIESAFKSVYPDETFSAHFIEEEITQMHRIENTILKVSQGAMEVTIFISCIGVFGLSMFTATRRTREIGIRKVLGASVWKIVRMLNVEFAVLIVIAIVIATPLAWLAMRSVLMTYTYHIDLSWWYFALGGLIALVTGLITVSFQSLKAANSDPVKTLKTE